MARRMEGVRRANPTFQYILHDGHEHMEDPFIKRAIDRKVSTAFIVDRIRMLVLAKHGGIYVDADCAAVKSFESIAPILDDTSTDFIYGLRSPDRKEVRLHGGVPLVDNSVLASAKNGRMINRLLELYHPSTPDQTGHSIGLHILRHADGGSRGLNYRYFYAQERYPETIVDHDSINLASWVKQKI